MRTPAQIAGHPIHPMLVTLPIGMWVFSLAADLIALRSATPATWHASALYTMVGGIIGALLAAVAGLVDLLSLREPIKGTAIKHMSLNLIIVVLYVVNAWTRVHASVSQNASIWLSVVAIALLLVSGWLGGKMVFEAGVAVHATDPVAAASPDDAWSGARDTRRRSGGWVTGDRAMAADSEGPSRDSGQSRR